MRFPCSGQYWASPIPDKMLKKFTTQNMGYGETHRYKQPMINFLLNITNGVRQIKIKNKKNKNKRNEKERMKGDKY